MPPQGFVTTCAREKRAVDHAPFEVTATPPAASPAPPTDAKRVERPNPDSLTGGADAPSSSSAIKNNISAENIGAAKDTREETSGSNKKKKNDIKRPLEETKRRRLEKAAIASAARGTFKVQEELTGRGDCGGRVGGGGSDGGDGDYGLRVASSGVVDASWKKAESKKRRKKKKKKKKGEESAGDSGASAVVSSDPGRAALLVDETGVERPDMTTKHKKKNLKTRKRKIDGGGGGGTRGRGGGGGEEGSGSGGRIDRKKREERFGAAGGQAACIAAGLSGDRGGVRNVEEVGQAKKKMRRKNKKGCSSSADHTS